MDADGQLPIVGLTSQVDLLWLDLIGDVDKQHIKIVVINVVGLEEYLDFVGGFGRDGCGCRDQHEGHGLLFVGTAMHLGLQVEFNWERTHVLDLETLLHSFVHKDVSEGYQTFFRLDGHLGPDSNTFDHN